MKLVSEFDIRMKQVKWSDMFDSVEELIESLKNIDFDKFMKERYKGYEYIGSFKRQLENGRDLSPKQITQLKRLAKAVYSYEKGYHY